MHVLVEAVFKSLNATAVKNNNEQPWLNGKTDFLAELADILEYGVKITDFAYFWVTETILSDSEILGMVEFDEVVNDYDGRLHFALFLGTDNFISNLDGQNYKAFVKFHEYFWYSIARLACDD